MAKKKQSVRPQKQLLDVKNGSSVRRKRRATYVKPPPVSNISMYHHVGIDIGRKVHVAFSPKAKKFLYFAHTDKGFSELLEYAARADPDLPPIFALEDSGISSNALSYSLWSKGMKVVKISGRQTKDKRFELTNSYHKNDEVDAEALSVLVSEGKGRLYKPRPETIQVLRDLIAEYVWLTREISAAKNRFVALVDEVFPELAWILDLNTVTPLEIMKKYHHAEGVAKTNKDEFSGFVYEVSNFQISHNRALEIRKAAKKSLGRPKSHSGEGENFIISMMCELQECKDLVEDRICEALDEIPYAKNITSIPGFGPITTAGLISQLGNLTDYNCVRQLYKACGLNMIESSSGQVQSSYKISHSGSSLARMYLFQATTNAFCRKASEFYPWYDIKIKAKMPKIKVMVAGMRKLLRIVFAIVRDNVPFNESRFLSETRWT